MIAVVASVGDDLVVPNVLKGANAKEEANVLSGKNRDAGDGLRLLPMKSRIRVTLDRSGRALRQPKVHPGERRRSDPAGEVVVAASDSGSVTN